MKKYCLVYTENEGGEYQVVCGGRDIIKKSFDESIKTKQIKYITSDLHTIQKINVAYVCMTKEIDNYDFIIKRKR